MFDLRAKNSKETDILMYGSISEWGRVRCEDFIRSISDAKAKGYERVNLKINSPGGSIFEGIAIMSQMISQEVFITGVVEGIAASMASVMLQGCHRRKMVKGTRLMVHQGAGGVFGSANQIRDYAELLDSLNKTIADIYARKTKKEVKWILEHWMAEGKDTWFTAEQALKEGLIDEIIEGNVKPMDKEQATLVEMAAHYQQFLDTNNKKMDREELIKQLGLKAEATDAEILAAIANLKASEKEKEVEGQNKEKDPPAAEKNDALDVIAALAKDRGMTDAQIESVKVLAKTDMKAAMALIPEKKAEATSTLSVSELLKAFKEGDKGTGDGDRAKWTLRDWEQKDGKGLQAMINKEPQKYAKLFQAAYGYEPKIEDVKELALTQ
jgi:ATP-dependent Clp endopeptidase proteolytic subunit ClpP